MARVHFEDSYSVRVLGGRKCLSFSRLCLSLLFLDGEFSRTSALTFRSFKRRDALKLAVAGLVSQHSPVAWAACLPGDLSPECIGVYKLPMDDAMLPYSGTKESLKTYAPDVKYVPPVESPKSIKDALETLQTQRLAADDIVEVVSEGRLEEAGIKVLNLLPKVTAAGRLVVSARLDASKDSETVRKLRRNQLQSMLEDVTVGYNKVDIAIGQGIRGEMGASAVAQLTILDELKEANRAFDDFLAAATSG